MRRDARRSLVDADHLWRWMNATAIRRHEQRPVQLPERSQRILDDLRSDGVATFVAGELLDINALVELRRMLDDVHEGRAEEITRMRQRAQDGSNFFDPFRISLFEDDWRAEGELAITRLALQPTLKEIVDAYVGLETVVTRPRAWRTFGSDQPARRSQLFHTDFPIDRYMVKVFAYLSDVDEDCGPLTVLPGTHPRGSVQIDPAVFHHDQLARSHDDAIDTVFPRSRWRHCVGPADTLILADFRSWHRGGWGRRDRVHAQALYISPAARRLMRGRV